MNAFCTGNRRVAMERELAVIVPSYNEARRLPPYLAAVRSHLDDRYPAAYEVIVVDDGSDDGLPDVLAPLEAEWPELSVIRHEINRGKGAAVRTGMLAADARRLLFADADGATPIDQETRLSEAIASGADLAVASRLVPSDDVVRRRGRRRAIVGRLFASVARRYLRLGVRDCQCGFKMFRREPARKIFSQVRETGFLFDLEVLILADRHGYETAEVPVDWSDVPGGHFHPIRELLNVLIGLRRLRRRSMSPQHD